MLIKALKGKIHRARVTQTKIDYPGSVGIDEQIMEKAGIVPYEEVLLANVTNGARVETYVVPADRGKREIIILGAAARHFNPGDIVIVMNFAYFTPDEMKKHKPQIIICDENNRTSRLK
ncbi:MAG TPA: aspartate 1-decarboxylase [Anaerohalosphaeraceae bacterium]|jgi:aspartate 1-decarboxylase|nr:aspartate 1-decarboxylase [Anaerohalosphaeraceae bacterium]